MSNPEIKVSVIGAGGWGKNIVRTLAEMGSLESIIESDGQKRAEMTRLYPGIPVLESLDQSSSPTPKAVAIATPAPTHFKVAKPLMERGWNVFIEKPLTLDLGEAIELASIVSKTKAVGMVGHLLVYQPAMERIAKALSDGTLGSIVSIHCKRLGMGTVRRVENALWSLGVHDLAVMLSLMKGTPTKVEAFGLSRLQKDIEDTVFLNLRFPGNVGAHLHCSWWWPERERGLTVVGTRGAASFNEITGELRLHRRHFDPQFVPSEGTAEVVRFETTDLLRNELNHFIDCVRTGTRPRTDMAQGVSVVEILNTADQLLRSQRGDYR